MSDFVVNAYNIRIKKCCASCAYKDLMRTQKRLCLKKNETVEALDVCNDWTLTDQLKDAGKSRGVVRDKETKEILID